MRPKITRAHEKGLRRNLRYRVDDLKT